jgi:adenylate kinase family enzyme
MLDGESVRQRIAVIAEPGVFDAWGAVTLFAEAVGLQTYNVGDLCRAAVQDGAEWGRRFMAHVRAGEQVPDGVLAEFVADTLARSRGCWVLFNHPGTVRHAELLAEHGHAPDTVIEVRFDEDRIDQDWRLAERREEFCQILTEHRLRMAPVNAFYRTSDAFNVVRQSASPEELAADLRAIVVSPGR